MRSFMESREAEADCAEVERLEEKAKEVESYQDRCERS